MTVSSSTKLLNQLKNKPAKLKRYNKYNKPKKRDFGAEIHRCRRCGNTRGHVGKYGLDLCRRCFREIATSIGFKKYR